MTNTQAPPTVEDVPKQTRAGFAVRLLMAESLVLVAGAVTTWLVASAVAPGLFHRHLREAGMPSNASETQHVEAAFSSALLASISVALLAAVVTALAVTWYFSRRVERSISAVARAAAQIAAGNRGTRVADPRLGPEFGVLAASYNSLAERLEATETSRRRMLADLAHEMRTPLATIDAHLEAIEDGVRTADESTMAVLSHSTQRLIRLAEDIAAVSRAEESNLSISPRLVDASALAEAVVLAAQGRYGAKGVTLHASAGSGCQLRVDPDRIGQVLTNLLDNALRHTPAGGTVWLECRHVEGWVEYRVRDTGEGIAAEHLPHLFDRFYRVDAARDRRHGGSGIGLSIAKALVEAHHGGISVASEGPGKGTLFTVRLPRVA